MNYYTCPDCGFDRITKNDNRCPGCVVWIDWNDES